MRDLRWTHHPGAVVPNWTDKFAVTIRKPLVIYLFWTPYFQQFAAADSARFLCHISRVLGLLYYRQNRGDFDCFFPRSEWAQFFIPETPRHDWSIDFCCNFVAAKICIVPLRCDMCFEFASCCDINNFKTGGNYLKLLLRKIKLKITQHPGTCVWNKHPKVGNSGQILKQDTKFGTPSRSVSPLWTRFGCSQNRERSVTNSTASKQLLSLRRTDTFNMATFPPWAFVVY